MSKKNKSDVQRGSGICRSRLSLSVVLACSAWILGCGSNPDAQCTGNGSNQTSHCQNQQPGPHPHQPPSNLPAHGTEAYLGTLYEVDTYSNTYAPIQQFSLTVGVRNASAQSIPYEFQSSGPLGEIRFGGQLYRSAGAYGQMLWVSQAMDYPALHNLRFRFEVVTVPQGNQQDSLVNIRFRECGFSATSCTRDIGLGASIDQRTR